MPTRLHLEAADARRVVDLAAAELSAPLSQVLGQHGLALNTRCGGRGLCSGCEIEVREGSVLPLAGAPAPRRGRLRSCQHRAAPDAPASLFVPPRSLLRHAPSVVSEFQLGIPWGRDPLDAHARYGAAVDVGTTTVALLLCDLATGAVVAEASAFNAQVRFGEDVVTRIQLCTTDKSALAAQQRAVAAETIQPLLARATAAAGLTPAEVGVMTVAGNTTMQHLLAGADPSPLGTHPFTPVFLEHRTFPPAALGLAFGGASALVHLLPSPAAYVGADLAAGMIATGLYYEPGPALLVDIGTNGEIVAKGRDRLLGCATAAGPAFEGAGLSCGTRAVRGAIERVTLTAAPFAAALEIIGGDLPPLGLCGSAYIDLLWEGRRTGILDANGRFSPAFATEAGAALQQDDFGRKLRLTPPDRPPVFISEPDIARLLQAKAAIAAGIDTLLHLLDLRPADIRTLHLAGGFGLHLSLDHATGCGLLPGFRPDQIRVVGNTSLGGAFLALNDRSLLADLSAACRDMESIELNLQPGFEDAYIDHLALP